VVEVVPKEVLRLVELVLVVIDHLGIVKLLVEGLLQNQLLILNVENLILLLLELVDLQDLQEVMDLMVLVLLL